LNDTFVLPSLEGIEQMEWQRSQAIKAPGMSGDSSVKDVGIAVSIVGKLNRLYNYRVVILQRRIMWVENYRHGDYCNGNTGKDEDLKA